MELSAVTVLIPSLDPDEKLAGVVSSLIGVGFSDIVLIDDGSDAAHRPVFDALAARPQVTVLTHPVNRGKGRALKTGFAFILAERPECRGVVTVDGDGQHAADDVSRIAQALLADDTRAYLGVRDFSDPHVPGRSRFGNRTTCLVLRLFCGVRVSDSQTGLRGFPRAMLPMLGDVPGERFEYETNVLLTLGERQIPIGELPIGTIYIDGNESSHFRPIRDSVRIYLPILRQFFRFVGSSLLSAVADLALFALFARVVFVTQPLIAAVFLATVTSRVLSAAFNYMLNRLAVFRRKERLGGSLWRYALLCVGQMNVSALLVWLFCTVLPIPKVVVKAVVDTLLFFVSYRIQDAFVFRARG